MVTTEPNSTRPQTRFWTSFSLSCRKNDCNPGQGRSQVGMVGIDMTNVNPKFDCKLRK